MKQRKVKHARRKVTEEQVSAMQRECELHHSNETFVVGSDGRLTRTAVVYYDWDRIPPNSKQA